MNVSDIKIRVKRQFGDESGAQITDADIVRWANDGQLDIVRRTECLQKEGSNIAVTAGTDNYPLPADFMLPRRATLDGYYLAKTTIEDLDTFAWDRDNLNTQALPDRYYFWGQKIFLYPIPAASGTLVLTYVKTPTTLANDSDIPEIPLQMHEDIVRYCIARAKELNEDFDQSEIIMRDYTDRVSKAREESQASDVSSYPAVRALPGDDY